MRNLVCDLEPRLMLYSFTLSSGILRLYCDTVSQDLSVTISGSNIQATLMQGSVMTTQQQWTTASVQAIYVNADAGNDRVKISNKIKQPASIAGGAGDDTIISGGGNDLINGGIGDDIIDGGGGSDTMSGGNGFDTVDYSSRTADLNIDQDKDGGDGEKGENDSVSNDIYRILCGTGNDTVHGTNNTVVVNYIWGNEGNDTLWGGDGDDTLVGSGGNDNLYGEGGRDLLYGETGKDRLYGGTGNDTLKGGKGIDQLFGERGNDKLYDRDGYIDLIDGGADTDSVLDKDKNDKVVSVP